MVTLITNCHIICAGAFEVGGLFFGEEELPVTIGSVSCDGSEARLLNCSYSTDVTCQTDRNDAGVVCQGTYIVQFPLLYMPQLTCNFRSPYRLKPVKY